MFTAILKDPPLNFFFLCHLFISCECEADLRSVAAEWLTPWAIWVMDTSVSLLLALMDALSCSLRLREPERETGRESSVQQHWLLCSECLGGRTKILQDWTCSKGHCFPITHETIQRLCQVFSLTHGKTFSVRCTCYRILLDNIELNFNLLFCLE